MSSHAEHRPTNIPRTSLNIGSGPRGSGLRPRALVGDAWCEIRVDADPSVGPDVLTPAHDLGVGLPREGYATGRNATELEFPFFEPALRDWTLGTCVRVRVLYP